MRILPALAFLLLFTGPVAAAQEPPSPGTISVEIADDAPDQPANAAIFADAVKVALLDARFLTLPATGHGRYIARATVTHVTQGTATAPVAASRSQADVSNWGAHLTVPLRSKNRVVQSLVRTQLNVDIVRRDTGQSVWRGSALTVQAEGEAGSSPAVAGKLAGAVMRQFPDSSSAPVTVP